MGGLFGGNKKKDAAKQAAAAQRAAEEKERAKRKRDQSYGARGQRLSSSLDKEASYAKDNTYIEDDRSNKLGNSAMNYNLLNVKLGQ